MRADPSPILEPLDLLVAGKVPRNCLDGVQQRLAMASELLASQGSRTLETVGGLLEEAVALLNHAQKLLSQASPIEKAQLSENVRNIQRMNRLLAALVNNGSSLYDIRLAKVLSDLGGYTADGRPAAYETPPALVARG